MADLAGGVHLRGVPCGFVPRVDRIGSVVDLERIEGKLHASAVGRALHAWKDASRTCVAE